MCLHRLIISFAFCLPIATGTKAQESLNYFFRHISQSDGLLHNEVLSIAQDGKGFIWIATANGLQRYDGSRFIYYREMLSVPVEGATRSVELYADKQNNLLWIANNTSIEKMEPGKNHFAVYDQQNISDDPSFGLTSYRDINNEEWLLGRNALYRYDSITKKNILYYTNILPENLHQTSFIAADSVSGNTWVATGSQLLLFDKKNRKAYSGILNDNRHPLLQWSLSGAGKRFLRFVMTDSKGKTWITTWGDMLYKYDEEAKEVKAWSLSAVKTKEDGGKSSTGALLVSCIMEDDNHAIWIGTENAGLLRYNEEKDNFDYCIMRETNPTGIRYNYKIYSLFQDKEQNIWIGTDKGISIFNPYRQYFNSVRHEENNLLSISKSEITSFIQTSSGAIFIGTWGGGIAEYDAGFHFKRNISFKDAAENNMVWSFIQMDAQTLWIGCQHGNLLVYNVANGTTKTLHPPEMENSTIRCMEKDDRGNIWFGLQNGKITKWDKEQDKFFHYSAGLQDNIKKAATVLNIFIDRAQHCWVGTEAGFKEFDLEKMVYTYTWLPDKYDVNTLSGKTCQGIEEYNDSILLVGTIKGGLNFFNKRTKTFSHLTTADGLPSNSIYAIKKDTTGHIWLTTDYGLCKFDPADKKFIPYSMEPGLVNSSLQSNKFYTLQDGQWLIFSTTEAISFFPHKENYQETQQTKVEITGFNVFNKPVFIDSFLLGNKPVRLSYKENFFRIEFAALNFSGQKLTNYYYRLYGIDKDWVNGETRRFANYTDLQPGEYTFEVKAENGSDSGEITSFKIIIAPPFWQTWWFISICLAIIGLLVFWLFRKRIKSVRHEAEMKQTIAETEMMALRAQMNPHFIFNCLNAIDNLIQTNQKEKATTYLAKFARLIRSVLDSSKNNVVPFQNDYESLQLYLQMEQFRCNNKFMYELRADDELLHSDYKLPPLIVQPFVENAIHHGLLNKQTADRKLAISATVENDSIKYTITDNGVGRIRAGEIKEINKPGHQSYGISITAERIHLYNQSGKSNDITITDLLDNGQPAGTRVEIRLKIYDSNKSPYA